MKNIRAVDGKIPRDRRAGVSLQSRYNRRTPHDHGLITAQARLRRQSERTDEIIYVNIEQSFIVHARNVYD